jgi:hypothetical protein
MKKHLACSLLAACLTLLPVAGYGQTIITSLPFTITQSGKYTLQSDLTVTVTPGSGPATQFAIMVLASDVVIDLNGFSIVGPQGSSVASIGIAVQGIEDVVIRNGEISGLTYGVSILNGTGITVENVRLSNNDFRGISGQGCHNALILNCKILKATSNNLSRFPNTAGVHLLGGFGNQVMNTTVIGLGQGRYRFGILSDESNGNYFQNNYIVGCNTGMFLSSPDKYRAITTTGCNTAITGGIDVDNASN